jgi:hypothetical protein
MLVDVLARLAFDAGAVGLLACALLCLSKYCLGVLFAHGPARGNALLPVLRRCRPYPPDGR